MKALTRWICSGMLIALIAGCASGSLYVPELPTHAKTLYLDYQAKNENKVFVVAIDPNGEFAVGYDYGKATVKEAYQSALAKCNANRESYGVLSEAHIYAINDQVVYENAIRKAMSGE